MAENCSGEKGEDILVCCQCSQVLVDPQTFTCLHSFCTKCVEDFKISTESDIDGYKCPRCCRFTPQCEVKVVPLIVQLLGAYSTAMDVRKDSKCSRCLCDVAHWQCLDCHRSGLLCSTCKNIHDEFAGNFGAQHQIVSIEELSHKPAIINKALYCKEHVDYKIEVFCCDCQRTVCAMCSVANHNGHFVEPIAIASQRLVSKFDASKKRIEDEIEFERLAIETIENEKREAISAYEVHLQNAEDDFEKRLENLRVEHIQNINELKSNATQEIKEYEFRIQSTENKISEQKRVLSWMKTTIERTAGVTLFNELQERILCKVEEYITEEPEQPLAPTENSAPAQEFQIFTTRSWPWKMARSNSALTQKQVISVPNASGTWPYTRLSLLWNSLWLFNHNTNHVVRYDLDGTYLGTFKLDVRIQVPLTAIQLSTKYAVVVAKSGLFSMEESGKITDYFFAKGDFSDACIAEAGNLYALEHTRGVVYVFSMRAERWEKDREIVLRHDYNASERVYKNTIAVTNETIYVAMVFGCQYVVAYDFSGRTTKKFTQNRTGHPSVCGVDADQSFLICDYQNKCLKQQFYTGNYSVLLHPGFHTWYAVFTDENTLWVIDGNSQLKRYVYG